MKVSRGFDKTVPKPLTTPTPTLFALLSIPNTIKFSPSNADPSPAAVADAVAAAADVAAPSVVAALADSAPAGAAAPDAAGAAGTAVADAADAAGPSAGIPAEVGEGESVQSIVSSS